MRSVQQFLKQARKLVGSSVSQEKKNLVGRSHAGRGNRKWHSPQSSLRDNTPWQKIQKAFGCLLTEFNKQAKRKSPLDDDLPFGAREEEDRSARPVVIGLVAAVALIVAIAVFRGCSAGAPEFTIDTGENSGENSVAVSTQTIRVHVIGAVQNPGVYELESGARGADAVEAAGGLSEDASADSVNLAATVNDGDQVRVYTIAEEQVALEAKEQQLEAAAQSNSSGSSGTSSSTASSTTSSSSSIDANGRVNINTASLEELQTVSGIGPATAQKIIDERTANGPFANVDDLVRVSGIGEKKLANMRDKLTV